MYLKNKKIVIPIIVLLCLLLILVVLEKTRITNFIKMSGTPNTAQQGPTAEQQKEVADADAAAKKEFIENGGDTGASTNKPDTNGTIDLTANQESNGTVTIITKLTGYSSGKCSLTVSNGDKTSSQEANVMYQPEFSTCAGFSIPVNTVGTGKWSIKLTVTTNGVTSTQNTSLEVK